MSEQQTQILALARLGECHLLGCGVLLGRLGGQRPQGLPKLPQTAPVSGLPALGSGFPATCGSERTKALSTRLQRGPSWAA